VSTVKYVVTILYDLVVLGLTISGIVMMSTDSRITETLVDQGLIYFIVTFAANLVVTILTILKLSPTMSLIAAIPQSTVCTIASTRLYSQLATEATKAAKVAASGQNSQGGVSTTMLTSYLRRRSSSSPWSVVGTSVRERSNSITTYIVNRGRRSSSSLSASYQNHQSKNGDMVDVEKGGSETTSSHGTSSDFPGSTASKVSIPPKLYRLADVLESQSSVAIQAYQHHQQQRKPGWAATPDTRSESPLYPFSSSGVREQEEQVESHHPFGNLAIYSERDGRMDTMTPIVTQHVHSVREEEEEEEEEAEQQQASAALPTSSPTIELNLNEDPNDDLAARYPHLFQS
jgi:hypothetical protein